MHPTVISGGKLLKHAHLPWQGLSVWVRTFPVAAPLVTVGAVATVGGIGYGGYRLAEYLWVEEVRDDRHEQRRGPPIR